MAEKLFAGPCSLVPEDPETRAVAALATRVHDTYLVPIQGAMYRGPMDVEVRAKHIEEVAKQLDVLEAGGPYTSHSLFSST